jgi:hypothetical protein
MHHDVKVRLGCRTVPYPVTGFRLSLFRTNVFPCPCSIARLRNSWKLLQIHSLSLLPSSTLLFQSRPPSILLRTGSQHNSSILYCTNIRCSCPVHCWSTSALSVALRWLMLSTAGTPIGLSNVVSHTFIDNGAQTTETCIIHPCGTPDQKPGLKQLEVQICTVLPSALFLKHPKVI